MGAAFDNAALVQHEHKACFADSAEAMGDNERSATAQQYLQGALEPGFRDGVDGAGGFVKHQDTWIGQERAGEANELALA